MSKFWQKKYISKYSGEEIDAAVAKADTVPAVTVEDAGSALVVDEEGKIVPGEAGTTIPKITITQEELGTLIVNIGSFLAAANDTIKLKTFYIDDTQGVSIANKLKTILDNGIGYIEIEGMMQSLAYKVDETCIATPAIAVMLGQSWVSFGCTYQISDDFNWIYMNITAEKINVQS